MKQENLQGKYFSITDKDEMNTVIYQINRNDQKEHGDKTHKFTVERLEYTEQLIGENKRKKTFYVDNPAPEGNPLVFLSFGNNKVIVNTGFLDYDEIIISKKPMPMKLTTLYNENEVIYKEFTYTPNMKRPISIIDPETTEEIKPVLYMDEKTNEVRGKCRLEPYKKYFAFEIGIEKNKQVDLKGENYE